MLGVLSTQHLMDGVLAAVKAALAYLNDVLTASPNLEQHLQDIRQVFTSMRSVFFVVQKLDFLGNHVAATGISPLPLHVAALQPHPLLRTIKQLHGFDSSQQPPGS